MQKANLHIDNAIRMLEMLRHFAENRDKLSINKHVPTYYNKLMENIAQIQSTLLTDNEYTERVQRGFLEVNKDREFTFNATQDSKGKQFYAVEALLPLREMKSNVIFTGKVNPR
jgi:hypothetical protein